MCLGVTCSCVQLASGVCADQSPTPSLPPQKEKNLFFLCRFADKQTTAMLLSRSGYVQSAALAWPAITVKQVVLQIEFHNSAAWNHCWEVLPVNSITVACSQGLHVPLKTNHPSNVFIQALNNWFGSPPQIMEPLRPFLSPYLQFSPAERTAVTAVPKDVLFLICLWSNGWNIDVEYSFFFIAEICYSL